MTAGQGRQFSTPASSDAWYLYVGPGSGLPGFVSMSIPVPAGCTSWSLSAAGGYVDFRSVDANYVSPPPPVATNTPIPTETFTPLPTETGTPIPTATFTPTLTATDTLTPMFTETLAPGVTPSDTPSPTSTSLSTSTLTSTPSATLPPGVTPSDTPVPTNTPLPPAPTNTPVPPPSSSGGQGGSGGFVLPTGTFTSTALPQPTSTLRPSNLTPDTLTPNLVETARVMIFGTSTPTPTPRLVSKAGKSSSGFPWWLLAAGGAAAYAVSKRKQIAQGISNYRMKIRERKRKALEAQWETETKRQRETTAQTARNQAVEAKLARMEAEDERRWQQAHLSKPVTFLSKFPTHAFSRKPKPTVSNQPKPTSSPAKPSLWSRFTSAVKTLTAPLVNVVQKPVAPSTKPKPWWQRAGEWVQRKIVQPDQDFIDCISAPPNPKGALYPSSRIQIASTTLQFIGSIVDQKVFGGRVTQTVRQLGASTDRFLNAHPEVHTAWNIVRNAADFAGGFLAQSLDDMSFGLYGRLTHLQWENGSDAFQYGRQAGRLMTTIAGTVETFAGVKLTLDSVKVMFTTCGAAAVCAGVTGGACLPFGGLAIAVETAGVLVGTGMAIHGSAMLMRNAANAVGGPQDPTLRYGSNTGDTSRNAEILRDNMKQAGIHPPPDCPNCQPHHIVPSRSQNPAAREARRLLWEKFGIDINAAENGVFVPQRVNAHLNNKKYMEAVYDALKQAETQEDAIDILQRIAEQIRLTGDYP